MESYLYLNNLPKPTNLASKRLLQKTCNRLALAKVRVSRGGDHSCIFCGSPITPGDEYRNGNAFRSHDLCLREMARRLDA